ncbi:uncharacterized protein LOC144341334 [Macaca mulatta]
MLGDQLRRNIKELKLSVIPEEEKEEAEIKVRGGDSEPVKVAGVESWIHHTRVKFWTPPEEPAGPPAQESQDLPDQPQYTCELLENLHLLFWKETSQIKKDRGHQAIDGLTNGAPNELN